MELLDMISTNKESVLNTLFLTLAYLLAKKLWDKILADFTDIKNKMLIAENNFFKYTEKIEKILSEHFDTLQKNKSETKLLHSEFLKQIGITLHKLTVVEQELKSSLANQNLQLSEFKAQISFVANIRADLEKSFGKINRLDNDTLGLKIEIEKTQSKMEDFRKVLVTHNEWFKNKKS